MQRESRQLVTVALGLLLLFGAGCSRESRKARHLERANRYYAAMQYDKAEIEYLSALRLDARDPVAVRRLGIIYHDQGRSPQAFMFLRKAQELDPNDLEVRLKLGLSYLAARGFEEALAFTSNNRHCTP